jgi:hypothetical protein
MNLEVWLASLGFGDEGQHSIRVNAERSVVDLAGIAITSKKKA